MICLQCAHSYELRPGGPGCPACALSALEEDTSAWGASEAPADVGDRQRLGIHQAAFPAYRLEEVLGRGGFGSVYAAEGPRSACAFKVLSGLDQRSRRSARREVAATALLGHPAIVRIQSVVEGGGLLGLEMPRIDGTPMETPDRPAGDHDPQLVRRQMAGVAEALTYAHRRGVLHGDIKPSNLLRDRWERVFIVDWGIARVRSAHLLRLPTALGATTDRSTAPAGTPGFLAPEVMNGRGPVDGRSDVFSLCAVLYYLIEGRRPVGDFPPLSASSGPWMRRLEETLRRGLAHDQGDRPYMASLAALLHERPPAAVVAPGTAERCVPSPWETIDEATPASPLFRAAYTAEKWDDYGVMHVHKSPRWFGDEDAERELTRVADTLRAPRELLAEERVERALVRLALPRALTAQATSLRPAPWSLVPLVEADRQDRGGWGRVAWALEEAVWGMSFEAWRAQRGPAPGAEPAALLRPLARAARWAWAEDMGPLDMRPEATVFVRWGDTWRLRLRGAGLSGVQRALEDRHEFPAGASRWAAPERRMPTAEADASCDVYSLCALYRDLVAPGAALPTAVTRGLSASPLERPSLDALCDALDELAPADTSVVWRPPPGAASGTSARGLTGAAPRPRVRRGGFYDWSASTLLLMGLIWPVTMMVLGAPKILQVASISGCATWNLLLLLFHPSIYRAPFSTYSLAHALYLLFLLGLLWSTLPDLLSNGNPEHLSNAFIALVLTTEFAITLRRAVSTPRRRAMGPVRNQPGRGAAGGPRLDTVEPTATTKAPQQHPDLGRGATYCVTFSHRIQCLRIGDEALARRVWALLANPGDKAARLEVARELRWAVLDTLYQHQKSEFNFGPAMMARLSNPEAKPALIELVTYPGARVPLRRFFIICDTDTWTLSPGEQWLLTHPALGPIGNTAIADMKVPLAWSHAQTHEAIRTGVRRILRERGVLDKLDTWSVFHS